MKFIHLISRVFFLLALGRFVPIYGFCKKYFLFLLGQVGGTKIIDESADFSNLDEEELEKYTKIVKKTKPIRRPPPEKDYRPFISKETFDETKARNFKKWEVHRRLSNKPPFLMSTTSTRRTSESSNVSAITGTTELEIQRQVLAGTTQVCFFQLFVYFFLLQNENIDVLFIQNFVLFFFFRKNL